MAVSDLDIDSVVNALLKEYGYSEPGPRENTAVGAGASAVAKRETADTGVLSRIAEKMATADKRKEVYCEVCGLVKVKSGSSGVPACERCYKRMSVLREGKKEAVEFYSDPRNTRRASRRVKKYIQNAIDAARSRNPELLATEDVPARSAPTGEENPAAKAAPAPAPVHGAEGDTVRIGRTAAPAPRADRPSAEELLAQMESAPAAAPAQEEKPAAAPAPRAGRPSAAELLTQMESAPAAVPEKEEKPAAAPAPRAGRPSAAELLAQMDDAAAPGQDGQPTIVAPPVRDDDPLVAELLAQMGQSRSAATTQAEPPSAQSEPTRRRKHQAKPAAAHGAKPAAAHGAKPAAEQAPEHPEAAPASAPEEEKLPSLEEILAQVKEEMPSAPPTPPAAEPIVEATVSHPKKHSAALAARTEKPAAETRPARTIQPPAEPRPARPERPSLEEMLTRIGDVPPEAAAEKAAHSPAETVRSRRKKLPAPTHREKAAPATTAEEPRLSVEDMMARRPQPAMPKPPAGDPKAELKSFRPGVPAPETAPARKPQPAPETAPDRAAQPPAESPLPRTKKRTPAAKERMPQPPAAEAAPPMRGKRHQPEPAPAPAPEKQPSIDDLLTRTEADPAEFMEEEPSIEELLSRTEAVLRGSLPSDGEPAADNFDPLSRRPVPAAEAAAHSRTERHLARNAAPRMDERAARKASRPAFALNRPCQACGADEWVGIDGTYSYIELCNNCEKRKVEFNKQDYVDSFECPKCGGLTGTREENKRKFGVRCSNCGELTICFKKVDELLMDEKLTAALTDYAKALVNDPDAPVTCPQCGSESITTGTQGLSFLGIGRTVNRCARCGYAWRPQW